MEKSTSGFKRLPEPPIDLKKKNNGPSNRMET